MCKYRRFLFLGVVVKSTKWYFIFFVTAELSRTLVFFDIFSLKPIFRPNFSLVCFILIMLPIVSLFDMLIGLDLQILWPGKSPIHSLCSISICLILSFVKWDLYSWLFYCNCLFDLFMALWVDADGYCWCFLDCRGFVGSLYSALLLALSWSLFLCLFLGYVCFVFYGDGLV